MAGQMLLHVWALILRNLQTAYMGERLRECHSEKEIERRGNKTLKEITFSKGFFFMAIDKVISKRPLSVSP